MVRLLLLLLIGSLGLAGCANPFAEYYVPRDPQLMSAAPVDAVRVHRTGEQSAEAVCQQLYPDAVVLGDAVFVDYVTRDGSLREFARSVGADTVIWETRWLETQQHLSYHRRSGGSTTVQAISDDGDQVTVRVREPDRYEPSTSTRQMYRHTVLFLRTDRAIGEH
jgi:hypothetical protein